MTLPRPRKRFGQHFLHDPAVIRRIVEAVAPAAAAGHPPTPRVVEIGPGRGALTGLLLERVGTLDAIEIDRDLVAALTERFGRDGRLRLHSGDVLAFDFCALAADAPLRLVGNLPYNISTPLLFHLYDQAHCIESMVFMVQKEVAVRLAAPPGGKDYGRLSVMIQWRFDVAHLFDVGPGAFQPPPQVDSTVVRLTPRAPRIELRDSARFARVVQAAFGQRRKTLRNALRELVGLAAFERAGVDPNRRAETLTALEFAILANQPTE